MAIKCKLKHHEEKNSSNLNFSKETKRKMKLTISLHIFFPPVCRKSKVRKRKEKKKTERRWRDQDIGRNSDKAIADITLKKKKERKKKTLPLVFLSFTELWNLCCEMAIAAVIVLRGRAEKSNFIDTASKRKMGERGSFQKKKYKN